MVLKTGNYKKSLLMELAVRGTQPPTLQIYNYEVKAQEAQLYFSGGIKISLSL